MSPYDDGWLVGFDMSGGFGSRCVYADPHGEQSPPTQLAASGPERTRGVGDVGRDLYWRTVRDARPRF